MKKIKLYIVLFIYLGTEVFSQKYQPFDSTTVWTANQVYNLSTCSSCFLGRDVKYYSKGYVINNSRQWNKVYYNDKTYITFCITCTLTGFPIYTNNVLVGYYSNDTINKILYFHPSTSSLPPNYNPIPMDVLYNFNNKLVGDSLVMKSSTSYIFKITSIDSLLFSGKYHKRYQTNCVPTAAPIYGSAISFIEGIGSSLGPFEPMIHPNGDQYSYLKCFASPTQTLTVTNYTVIGPGACTNLALGIEEQTKSNILVYPNPSNGSIKIQIPNEIKNGSIFIYNLLGQKVYEQKLVIGENYISTTGFIPGIYNYVLFKDNQQINSGKLTLE